MGSLVIWQRAEGCIVFISAIVIYFIFGAEFSWWLAVVLFFVPDISFIAYLLGPKLGAIAYNLVHVYAFGAVLLAVGLGLDSVAISSLGTLWLAHSGFDRMLGYGLKSFESFNITHLGAIGSELKK